MNKNNLYFWEAENDMLPSEQPSLERQPVEMDPNKGLPLGPEGQQEEDPDISDDPMAPDMPEDKEVPADFEVWKKRFFKETIKGDTEQLLDLIATVRTDIDLQPYQSKFVEDNWNIQLLRRLSNIEKASKEIRKNIRDIIDKNNPATSVVNHMTSVLEMYPMLNEIFIKLNGYKALKGDLHRKFIGALLGAVQVGNGGDHEDIVFNEREYSIAISTRYNSRWGDVMLGSWALMEDDAERYLTEPELDKLQNGSPEEKDVLRRRIVIESISNLYKERAFIINVTGDDGTLYTLGWDIATSLKSAYSDGKIIVKTRKSDNSEAMISDSGEIIPLIDLTVYYKRDTGEIAPDGGPETELKEIIDRRNGVLFLTADTATIKEIGTIFKGSVFKENPYQGNPSDLKNIQRCVYSSYDLLTKMC